MPFALSFSNADESIIDIVVLEKSQYQNWLDEQLLEVKTWLSVINFTPESSHHALLPLANGRLSGVVVIIDDSQDFFAVGDLPSQLPKGNYRFKADSAWQYALSLSWGMGAYQFDRYKKCKTIDAHLFVDDCVDQKRLQAELESVYLLRDMINTPTEDMGPDRLSDIVADLATKFDADFSEIQGQELLNQNFPLIHAVGRAADAERAPRLIELCWGDSKHRQVTLVGKGVCYDTGGLSLKQTRSMVLMKKDMGGAAHVIALARYIMAMQLPICLRLLVPAVENAVSGNSIRPGDVITARNGVSVEITNTDAEGRLILADALAYAAEKNPDLLIDMATLTGAARVAMGPDVTPFMTTDEAISAALLQSGGSVADPMWPLPLYQPYRRLLKSDIADCDNASTSGYAGCILAGLFLQQFVADCTWLHCDVFGWRNEHRPARAKGGDLFALRAIIAGLLS